MATIFVEESTDKILPLFSRYNTFCVDLETTGLNPIDSRILLAQIGFPEGDTFVIDGSRVNLSPLMPFFASNKWVKIIQNGKFDTKFLLKYYNTRTRGIFDTFLAENMILSTGYGVSLADLAKKYMDVTLDKSVRESFMGMKPMDAFTEEQIGYAAEDAEVLYGIYKQQQTKLHNLGMDRIAEIEFELSPVVADMELVGVPVDTAKWRKKIAEYRDRHEASRVKMHELLFDGIETTEQLGMFIRDSINLNSPKQVKKAFAQLGIDLESTNEREISLINHPAAKELLEYRGFQKILTSYGENFLEKIHPFTNRIHADFEQIGTETGRFACKKPNLQNMPDEFRQCVTSPDHSLVVADFANIELRILAELSKDPVFIEAFSTGDDPHKSTAAFMFNKPIESVTYEERFMAKTINFGIAYGMGPYKLMDMLNARSGGERMGFKKVSAVMNRYKQTYKIATNWLLDAGNLAYRQGFSETMLGRKRFFSRPKQDQDFDKVVSAIKRQGANSPIQGTNADIMKLAMLNLYNDLRTYGFSADIIIQVHDEVVVLAHKKQAEAVKEVVEESMIGSAKEVIKSVPVKVDAFITDIWKKN